MRKLSWRHLTAKRLSKRAKLDTDRLIREMKDAAKIDEELVKKFQKYNIPIEEIDDVHVEFCNLDVSAKTKNMKIYINEQMLEEDSPVKDPTHYLIHELVHYLQQKTGASKKMKQKSEDYLDQDTEQEAFEVQVEYKKENEGEGEAERYVEQLLNHHDVKGKERKEKVEDLLG